MANDITGSCEIGESVELIPDAVDDILPAGYLDEGTLPLDTTEQDIGVDPRVGASITGDCASIECPPGYEWACCEIPSEFPTTPPIVLACDLVAPYTPDSQGNYTQLIDTGDGVLANRGYSAIASPIVQKLSYDMLTIDWTISTTKLGEGWEYFFTDNDGNHGFLHIPDSTEIYLKIIENTTGNVLQTVDLQTNGDSTQVDAVSVAYSYINSSIYVAHGSYITFGQSGSHVVLQIFNANTYVRASSVEIFSPYQIFPERRTAISVVDDKLIFSWTGGYRETSGGTAYYEYKLWNFSLDGTGGTIFDNYKTTSERDAIVGDRIWITKNHILINRGLYTIHSRAISSSNKVAQCGLRVYDRATLAFVKEIIDPYWEDYDTSLTQYGSYFGYGVSTYGNYTVVGSPRSDKINKTLINDDCMGRIYIYDADMNRVSEFDGPPSSNWNASRSQGLLITATHIYMSEQHYGSYGQNSTKICSYTNA